MRTIAFIIIALSVLACRPASAAVCDGATVDRWETERENALEYRSDIEADLERMKMQLAGLAQRIDEEQARQDKGKRFSRRRLESWLKQSRETAGEMERLTAERKTVDTAISRLGRALRDCYRNQLVALLERMLQSVRTRDYTAAAAELQSVREIELKIRDLEPDQPVADYPTISEDFIRNSLSSFEERAFLLDTMTDLRERAERDSVDLDQRLGEIRRSIQLKESLLKLTEEAAKRSGDAGSAFFREFGEDKVSVELDDLRQEEAAVARLLDTAVRAVQYYRERIELLNQLVGKGDD